MAGISDFVNYVTNNPVTTEIKKGIDSISQTYTTIKDKAILPSDISSAIAKSGILASNKYDTDNLSFPPDIGSTHNMLININTSTYSNIGGEGILKDQFSVVDTLKSAGSNTMSPPRQTRRINSAIRLYMPNTVVFSQANMYEEISLTGVASEALQIGGMINSGVAKAGAGMLGTAVNPKVELFFSNTALRTFQFDFLFAPTSEAEAFALWNIIYQLRLHTAPEIGKLGALLWVPPSEFDITFYMSNGQENFNIPKINTCVMENLDVDYAPSGIYSTFTTGFPVSVRVTMRLKEVEVLHRERVAQGF